MTDPNFRIEVTDDGIHVYNRDGHHVAKDPFDLFPSSASRPTGRTRSTSASSWREAQIAYQLGKRYAQATTRSGWASRTHRQQPDKAQPREHLQARSRGGAGRRSRA